MHCKLRSLSSCENGSLPGPKHHYSVQRTALPCRSPDGTPPTPPCRRNLPTQPAEPCPLHSATPCGPHPPVVPSMRRVLHPEQLRRDPHAAPFRRHFLVVPYGMNPEAHCEQHALHLAAALLLCLVQPYNALRIALPAIALTPPPPPSTGFHLLCWPSAPRICLMSGSSHTWTPNTTARGSLRSQILVGVLRLPRRPITDAQCSSHSSCHRTSLTTNSNCTSFQVTTVLQPTPHTPANSAHAQCSRTADNTLSCRALQTASC